MRLFLGGCGSAAALALLTNGSSLLVKSAVAATEGHLNRDKLDALIHTRIDNSGGLADYVAKTVLDKSDEDLAKLKAEFRTLDHAAIKNPHVNRGRLENILYSRLSEASPTLNSDKIVEAVLGLSDEKLLEMEEKFKHDGGAGKKTSKAETPTAKGHVDREKMNEELKERLDNKNGMADKIISAMKTMSDLDLLSMKTNFAENYKKSKSDSAAQGHGKKVNRDRLRMRLEEGLSAELAPKIIAAVDNMTDEQLLQMQEKFADDVEADHKFEKDMAAVRSQATHRAHISRVKVMEDITKKVHETYADDHKTKQELAAIIAEFQETINEMSDEDLMDMYQRHQDEGKNKVISDSEDVQGDAADDEEPKELTVREKLMKSLELKFVSPTLQELQDSLNQKSDEELLEMVKHHYQTDMESTDDEEEEELLEPVGRPVKHQSIMTADRLPKPQTLEAKPTVYPETTKEAASTEEVSAAPKEVIDAVKALRSSAADSPKKRSADDDVFADIIGELPEAYAHLPVEKSVGELPEAYAHLRVEKATKRQSAAHLPMEKLSKLHAANPAMGFGVGLMPFVDFEDKLKVRLPYGLEVENWLAWGLLRDVEHDMFEPLTPGKTIYHISVKNPAEIDQGVLYLAMQRNFIRAAKEAIEEGLVQTKNLGQVCWDDVPSASPPTDHCMPLHDLMVLVLKLKAKGVVLSKPNPKATPAAADTELPVANEPSELFYHHQASSPFVVDPKSTPNRPQSANLRASRQPWVGPWWFNQEW